MMQITHEFIAKGPPMETQVIIDNEYATLWYRPQGKIVHHQIHKFIHGDALREVLNRGLDAFTTYSAHKWLSDDRNNSTLTKEDGEWGLVNWSPRVFDAGWKYWAVVLPDRKIGQINLNMFMREYITRGLEVRVFEDPDEALRWLESVD
jgi:hypothetical protein